jgi:hypothetical protein
LLALAATPMIKAVVVNANCCKADTAREMLGEVLKRLAKREVLKYLPDHDLRSPAAG